jgi:hypothetical protein
MATVPGVRPGVSRPRSDAVLRGAFVVVPALTLAYVGLGVGQPPIMHVLTSGASLGASLGWAVRTVLTTAAACCLVLGPGFALRANATTRRFVESAAHVWVPGFLYLVGVGVAVWVLESRVAPETTAVVLVVPIPVWVWWATRRTAAATLATAGERVVLLIVGLVLAIGIGKAMWSKYAPAELFANSIARTFDPNWASDPRLQYGVVSLVAHGQGPYSKDAYQYFGPYEFSDRGPIAGLAAVPTVLSGGAKPPVVLPIFVPWEPYDVQGYAAYRILLMLLGATVLLGSYAVLRRFLTEHLAIAATLLIATTPFVVHETYFIWPKLLAASLGLSALVAVFRRHPLTAGLLLGLSYVAHPSGLFIVPGVLLTWLVLLGRGADGVQRCRGYPQTRWLVRWSVDAAWIVAGTGVVVVAWLVTNEPHVRNTFASYLVSANNVHPVGLGTWVNFRIENLADTLVPFRLYVHEAHTRALNSFYGPSPNIDRFALSYPDSLPFGVGLLYYPVYLTGLVVFARRATLLFLVSILLPFLGFIIFWGFSVDLLHSALQFLFVISVMAAFLGHTVLPERGRALGSRTWGRVVQCAASSHAIEILVMVMLPVVVTNGVVSSGLFLPTDLLALTLMAGATLTLGWMTWHYFNPDRVRAEVDALRTRADRPLAVR